MRLLLATLVVALLCFVGAAAQASAPPNPHVHVGVNDAKDAEVTKTVAIEKKRGQRLDSVVALESNDLGPINAGQTIRGQGEVEISVTCTEPMPQCVGKIYKYSPHVEVQFVLAKSPHSTKGQRLGKPLDRTCSQDYPDRNHHCVLVLDRTDEVKKSCRNCALNMVMTAWHHDAKKKEVLVIGGDSDHGIEQGRASISAAVFQGDTEGATRTYRSTKILNKKAPLVSGGSNSPETALGSVRIDDLKQGEALIVTATARADIRGLGYNVLTQGEVVISEKGANSGDNSGTPVLAVSKHGKVATQNGYNCTQGASDYRNPCLISKVGSAYMSKSALTKPNNDKGASVPLYVNLIGSFSAQYGKPYKSGDKVKIRSVDIRVERISAG